MKDPRENRLTSRSNFVLHAIVFMLAHVFMILLAFAIPSCCSGIIMITPIWCTALLIHCITCMIFNQKLFNAVINA